MTTETIRKKMAFNRNVSIDSFASCKEYVKQVLDSVDPGARMDVEDYDSDGRMFLKKIYSISSARDKALLARAIVELFDDSSYLSDAIPVAAELALSEAKSWFLNLTSRSIEDLRKVKINDFSNLLGCLLLFSKRHLEFANYLGDLTVSNKINKDELVASLLSLAEIKPDMAIDKLITTLPLFVTGDETEDITAIKFIISTTFKKYGDDYCIDLAKRFRENLPKEYQVLFYKALAQNPTPRFKLYLEELKKILEIEE